MQATAHHLDEVTSSPEIGETLRHIESTSLHIDRVTADAEYGIPPMLRELRETVARTTAALQ